MNIISSGATITTCFRAWHKMKYAEKYFVMEWNRLNKNIQISVCYSISPIISLSKMRLKWSKHIMQWNPMMRDEEIKSPQKMWRSFLRWGTVKVKLLETNAPQKILMIRFETLWFYWKMIHRESSKAELLQSSKCSSGNITSYSDVYLIKISRKTHETHV